MISSTLLSFLGKQIAIARNRRTMSQVQLNKKCQFPETRLPEQTWIAKMERGEKNITLEELERIAEACGHKLEIRLRSIRTTQFVVKPLDPTEHILNKLRAKGIGV